MAKLTLADLARTCTNIPITVAGQTLQARPLSGTETGQILAVFPQPIAPMGEDPDGGSAAPKVPNPADPKYRGEHAAWYQNFRAAVVGLAIYNADPEQLDLAGLAGAALIRRLAGDFGQLLNRELVRLFDQITDGAAHAAEAIEGN